jgi:hypothetical protein
MVTADTNAAAHAADVYSFFRVSVRDADTGADHSPLLTSAADVIAWVDARPAVATWRVKGSLVTKPGSAWRNDGARSFNYYEDELTAAQLKTHLWLAGHAPKP